MSVAHSYPARIMKQCRRHPLVSCIHWDNYKHYTPYSARVSPENVHKLMGFVLMLDVIFCTCFLLLSCRVYRVNR